MRIVHDIECLPNFFSIAIVDYDSDREWVFEISERKNEIKELVEFYKQVKYAIGFNSVHYDDIVLNFLFKNYNRLKSLEYNEITKQLKNMSDCVVNEQYDIYKQYKYQIIYTQIDLFLYWSKMLRLSKKLSLKSIAVGMNWKLIKEFPLKHTDNIKIKQIDEFLKYNFNDAYVTKELANRFKSQINLRVQVEKEFGVNCITIDAVKLAQKLLYKLWNKDEKEIETVVKNKIEINKILYPFEFNKIKDEKYKDGNPEFISEPYWLLKELKSKTVHSTNEIRYSVFYKNLNGTLLKADYGSGGIHALTDKTYYTDEEGTIISSDFASLYPNLYCNIPSYVGDYAIDLYAHHTKDLRDLYAQIKADRLKAKKEGDKTKDAVFKILLNSYYGLLNNDYSPLKNPEIALSICLNGQLILTYFCTKCMEAGLNVISMNTDSIEVLIPKGKEQDYYDICSHIESKFNLQLEHTKYKKLIYRDINNYIGITDNGKVKQKGLFVTNPELGNSNDELIIPKTLEAYFKDGIQPEQFIKNHQNIFDFTLANKISKDYTVWYNGQIQQQLNRYYISRKGYYLYKQKKDKNTMENVLKGHGVILYNEHIEKPMNEYNIDYQYYINKVNKIINELLPKQTLF